jgi:SAM-dependent methyltransferase
MVRRAATAAKLSLDTLRNMRAGLQYAHRLPAESPGPGLDGQANNPLEAYFDSVTEGPGIWKWRHYFAIYHRHLQRFVGKAPRVLEIGIYSGGSLPMWLHYFGDGTQVYGVDIEPACTAHEREGVRVFIGDQADPEFWERFVSEVPRVDVVIDDGGHEAHQQIASLRSLLPHLAPGGVYVCEDVTGAFHQFHSFVDGLTRPLSTVYSEPTAFHGQVGSVHHYPALTVIEKPDRPVERFEAVKHGTVWEPGIY